MRSHLTKSTLTLIEGWATADSLLRRLVPLWMGARQLEFSWEYTQMAIQANINLVRLPHALFFLDRSSQR